MQSRVPFLVGRDLWMAINGEEEDEPAPPKSTLGASFISTNINIGHLHSEDENLKNSNLRTNIDNMKNYFAARKSTNYFQQNKTDFESSYSEFLRREPCKDHHYCCKNENIYLKPKITSNSSNRTNFNTNFPSNIEIFQKSLKRNNTPEAKEPGICEGFDWKSNTKHAFSPEYHAKEEGFKEYKMFSEERNDTAVHQEHIYAEMPIKNVKKFETNFEQNSNINYDCYARNMNMEEMIKQLKTANYAVKPQNAKYKNQNNVQSNMPKELTTSCKRENEAKQKGFYSSKHNYQKPTKKENCCRFCLKNGEVEIYYQSHLLKDSAGNIVCPILSKYTCPCCGATGKKAHTIRHCPLNVNYSEVSRRNSMVVRRNAAGHITSFRV